MRVLLFANTDWYLFNFRLPLARELRKAGAEVILVSPPGPFVTHLRAAGFHWVPFTFERLSLNPILEIVTLLRLISLYRALRPDVVHHFTIKCVVYGSIAARLLHVDRRLNAVAGLGHTYSNGGRRSAFLRWALRLLFRFCLGGNRARLILQNPDDREMFIGSRLAKERDIRLIRGSGVDTMAFHPGCRSEVGSKRKVLLAARLLKEKGVFEFASAARQLGADSQIEFLIAGEPDVGNPSAITQEQLEEWRVKGPLRPLGHVEDMVSLLREVDLFVLPTYYGEGVPKSLIEAAACGLPLVATDMPGCREVVSHGVNGLLVPPRDSHALAEAISFILSDPNEIERMGRESRRIAVEQFDEKIVLHQTLAVYEEICSGPLRS